MAVAAEALETPPVYQEPHVPQEKYAHSLYTLRQWGGSLLLENEVQLGGDQGFRELSFGDYVSALREMVRTDSELSERLDIDDKRGHRIIDGQACDANGTPMASVIANGRAAAEAEASLHPEFQAQAIRDAGDEIVAQKADALKPGQAFFTLSMEPKEELINHRETYRGLLGYRDGLSYLQYYAKVDEDTMIAGSYSVDMSDETAWRQLFADMGAEVPPDADPNTFIRHGFERKATPAEAERLVEDIRGDYYERRGATQQRYSVSEYLEKHDDVVRTFFDTYYSALAKAVCSGKNNEIMQNFAQTTLGARIEKLKPEIQQNLARVADGEAFNDEMAKTMDSILRYAVVEELRKGLKSYVGLEQPDDNLVWRGPLNQNQTVQDADVLYRMNNLLANNVSSGVSAGRSYGGCPGQIELSALDDETITGRKDPQSAYGGYNSGGGLSNREKWKTSKDKCVVTTCPTRPGEVEVGPCGVCMNRCQKLYDVGKDPTKMGSVTRKVAAVVASNRLKPTPKVEGSNTAQKKLSYSYN